MAIFKSIPQKNLVCISTSQGAKSGWDVNVFSLIKGRKCGRQLSLPWAGPACLDAARTPHHSPAGPGPRASATSMETEAGGWEFVFSFLTWKPGHWVSVTRGSRIKRWLSPPLNYAHRTHVRFAEGLKNQSARVCQLRQGKLTKFSPIRTHQYLLVPICTNKSLDRGVLWFQPCLLI